MEAIAVQRSIEVVNLQKLNEQIIDRMHTGIIVVNHDRQLLLINVAAKHLLGIDNFLLAAHSKIYLTQLIQG